MVDKKQIRKQVFSKRKELSENLYREWSDQIKERLFSIPSYQEADQLLIYVSFGKEVDTIPLIKQALLSKKDVLVPKVIGKEMIFIRIHELSELKPGAMGILEPEDNTESCISQHALMIMPGVAFDETLHRIGYGGGYYDKYLEKHRELSTIALGFELQIFPELPYEPTDIRPMALITEKRILQ